MSKNKQLISEKTKGNLKLGFSTLINNSACVEAGRNKPWYPAVIMGVLSVILAAVPVLVSNITSSGASFLNSPKYGYEIGLVSFQESLKANNLSMKVDDATDSLIVDSAKWKAAYPIDASQNIYYFKHVTTTTVSETTTSSSDSSTSLSPTGTGTTQTSTIDFVAYYTSLTGADFDSYVSATLAAKDPNGNTYCVNSLFLGAKQFRAFKYVPKATSYNNTVYGLYDNTRDFDLQNFTSEDSHGVAYAVTSETKNATNLQTYVDSTVSAWATFFSDGYVSTKTAYSWEMTGISEAVYVILVFFMGLMVFLMTRGKTNPFRIYTFWESQKIAYWCAPTPALLSMIIGFIFPAYATLVFVALFGIRVMWMSTKTLRPDAPSK